MANYQRTYATGLIPAECGMPTAAKLTNVEITQARNLDVEFLAVRQRRTDHSRETGSIATACLARSSSPLGPTTHSCSNGDFPEPGD